MAKQRAHGRRVVILLAVVTLVAAACSAAGEDGQGSDDDQAGGDDGVSDTATLLSAYADPQDAEGVDNLIAAFTERHPRAEIVHEQVPTPDDALARVNAGDAPAMMLVPPRVLAPLHADGAVVPLDEAVDVDTVEAEYVPGVLRSGMVGDDLVGLPVHLNVESLVWYRSDVFAERGYEVPETWEDLVALTDRIRGDMGAMGIAPWCVGVEDGATTGDTLTDWVEDVMLRLHGADVYDRWVGHDVPFASPEVRQAFEQVAEIWFTEGNVLGDQQNIAQTNIAAAPAPMFEDPPACLLHRQAGSIQGAFPDNAEFGGNYDVFTLPAIGDGAGEAALLTAGDVLAVTEDSPLTRAFVRFAASAEGQQAWAKAGSMVCANTTCPADAYPDAATGKQASLLADAPVARVDASDLMPADVGADAFLDQGTAWVAGERRLGAALRAIDAAWPRGACGVSGVGSNC